MYELKGMPHSFYFSHKYRTNSVLINHLSSSDVLLQLHEDSFFKNLQIQKLKLSILSDWKQVIAERTMDIIEDFPPSPWNGTERIELEPHAKSIQVVLLALDSETRIYVAGFLELLQEKMEEHNSRISLPFHVQDKALLSATFSAVVVNCNSNDVSNMFTTQKLLADDIELAFQLMSIVPDDNPHKSEVLYDIGEACRQRFRDSRSITDINNSLLAYEKASQIAVVDHSHYKRFVHAVGLSTLMRYEETGNFQDIDRAVLILEYVVRHSTDEDVEITRWLNNLGSAYINLFGHTGNKHHIDNAISVLRRAISLAPEGHVDMISSCNNLGNALVNRAESTSDLQDIDDAISVQRQAISLTPADDWNLPGRLNNLGNCLLCRFELTCDLNDVTQAVSVLERAIDITPDGHPALLVELNTLSSLLLARFSHSGQLSDLVATISALERAKELSNMDHPGMQKILTNLGNAYRKYFEETGETEHLENAISAQRQTITLISIGHSSLPRVKHSLAYALCRKFEQTGDPSDIDEAVSLVREAISLTANDHKDAADWLHTLGTLLWKRFERNGNIHDIDESIHALQAAIHNTSNTSVDMSLHLDSLGIALLRRGEHTRTFEDVEEALAALKKAQLLIHDEHPDYSRRLNNLGNAQFCLFKKTRAFEDIESCVSTFRKALEFTPDGHADTSIRLSNLGNSLQSCFEITCNIGNINEAIEKLEGAVLLTPEGHASAPKRLIELGNSLRARYNLSKNIADIDRAIEFQMNAVKLTPESHAEVTTRLNDLGNSYKDRWRENGNMDDIKEAASSYRAAAISITGSPSLRLRVCLMWAASCAIFDKKGSIVAYEAAFALLPQVAWLGDTIIARQERLIPISDLVQNAVSAAIYAERCDLALEWLEQGRCLVWSQIEVLRNPMDQLHGEHPALANDLIRVSKALEFASTRETHHAKELSTGTLERISMEREARIHHRLAEEWESLTSKVRDLQGFEDFFCPISISTLSRLVPSEGPVVAINIAFTGSHALILTHGNSQPVCVNLDKFPHTKAVYLQKCMEACLISSGLMTRDIRAGRMANLSSSSSGMAFILAELWENAVKPILDVLQYKPNATPLPRIWWCTTGALSFLPIHAAGNYLQDKGLSLSDYAISSYIPALSSLLPKNIPTSSDQEFRILIVNQSDVPGLPSLPNAEKEVQTIQKLCTRSNINLTVLEGKSATVEEVLLAMERASWVHFACHASQDIHGPMKSGLCLYDGRLELSTLVKKSFRPSRLAFLSACQTAAGDKRMPEEAVHLAAAMLSSGYRGVIATMWSIRDEDAPFVAQEVYSVLLDEHGTNSVSDVESNAAEALHHATLKLREKLGDTEDSLLSWVPFIHIGI